MSEINKLKEKILIAEQKAKKLRSQLNDTKRSRKERTSHLIQVGSLLEIAGIDDVDKNILLGYFLWFHAVPEEKKKKLYECGKAEFELRKQQKEKKD